MTTATITRRPAILAPCSYCHAKAGAACMSRTGRDTTPHTARRAAVEAMTDEQVSATVIEYTPTGSATAVHAVHREGDRWSVAQEDTTEFHGHGYDGCGTALVSLDSTRWSYGLNAIAPEPHTPGCCADLFTAIDRTVRAWNLATAHSHADEIGDALQAVRAAAKRGGFSVAQINGDGYEWTAAELEWTRPSDGDYLIVSTGRNPAAGDFPHYTEFAKQDGHNHAAYMNGRTWSVGTLATWEILEERAPWEAEDGFCGTIWSNVDESGNSEPTARELRYYP